MPGEKGPGGSTGGANQLLPAPETLAGPISTGVVARGIPVMGTPYQGAALGGLGCPISQCWWDVPGSARSGAGGRQC